MENYEQKYKESLSWMKALYPTLEGSMKEDAEHYFPELRESEDERIRKELIETIRCIKEGRFPTAVQIQKSSSLIAWLEKQGEQKPKFKVGDTIKSKYDDRQFTIKSVDLDKGTYTYTQEGCGNDIDYADEEFELVDQNSAWSEEYENIIVKIKTKIAQCNGFNKKNREEVFGLIDSIRPQNTWKPSDEQMEILQYLCETSSHPNEKVIPTLESLYQDLKKLI